MPIVEESYNPDRTRLSVNVKPLALITKQLYAILYKIQKLNLVYIVGGRKYMDKCTHEVRKQYWKGVINKCLQRPEGMTAKQWLDENGICEQTYYSWLKKIREETYELATSKNNQPAVTEESTMVNFAEITIPAQTLETDANLSFRPDVSIHTGSAVIGISNTASDALLKRILEVAFHAR